MPRIQNWKDFFKEKLKDIEHIIYASQSNMEIKEGHQKDGKVERFHVLIPFTNPIDYRLDRRKSIEFTSKYLIILENCLTVALITPGLILLE